MKTVRLVNIVKTFKQSDRIITALDNINLTIKAGETLILMGPTGCGKTTLLKVIAGRESVDKGIVYWDDTPLTLLPPKAKQTCTVFEDYLSYSQKKPAAPLLFFKIKQWQNNIVPERIPLASQIMGIDEISLKSSLSRKISKGQQHKTDLARYIITQRPVFLFDNPFVSLDVITRQKTRIALKNLLERFKITSVIVTDNMQDAQTFDKRIALMEGGKITQEGLFSDLAEHLERLGVSE